MSFGYKVFFPLDFEVADILHHESVACAVIGVFAPIGELSISIGIWDKGEKEGRGLHFGELSVS